MRAKLGGVIGPAVEVAVDRGRRAASAISARTASRAASAAVTSPPSASAKVPSPANRSSGRLAPPTASRTAATSAASPSAVAWRKAPDGKATGWPDRLIVTGCGS